VEGRGQSLWKLLCPNVRWGCDWGQVGQVFSCLWQLKVVSKYFKVCAVPGSYGQGSSWWVQV